MKGVALDAADLRQMVGRTLMSGLYLSADLYDAEGNHFETVEAPED